MKAGFGAALLIAVVAACTPQAAETSAAPDPAGQVAAADATAPAPVVPDAAPPATGPIDGAWRCKMVGDIPLGTLTFTGGAYVFQTTNTNWEVAPNASDGSGTVTFNETYALPVDGPLKDGFGVTGAFGDGSFINWNNNTGMLFGCRRP